MRKFCLLILLILISGNTFADSFRCARKIVKPGDSGNMLLKKCGNPIRKFSGREVINDNGRKAKVTVSNWVYERNGKRDIIVSVRSGTIIKISVE